ESLDRLFDGDVAYKHDTGGGFLVEKAAVEQPRCDAFEISPSGPLVGYRMRMPGEGEALRIEQEALAAVKLSAGDFRRAGSHKIKGARRALRVRPVDVQPE